MKQHLPTFNIILNSLIINYNYLRNGVVYGVFFILWAMLFVSCSNRQVLPPLKETFSKRDKNPFGSYVFYNQLKQLFYNNELNTKKQNFETAWQDISDTASIYILISKNLFLSEAGQKAMLNYVNDGNSLFISSEYIDNNLLDSLAVTFRGGHSQGRERSSRAWASRRSANQPLKTRRSELSKGRSFAAVARSPLASKRCMTDGMK